MPRIVRALRRRLTYANVAATVALLGIAGGGAYAAVNSIPDNAGVFHGCVNKKTHALRVVKSAGSCRKAKVVKHGKHKKRRPGELAIAWNQKGQQGDPGPQGPGAQTFDTTVATAAGDVTLATLPSGVKVVGNCTGVRIRLAPPANDLRASGTGSFDGTLQAVDEDGGGTWTQPGSNNVDLDVIAFATSGPPARVDVHGTAGSPCRFWGMIIPG